MTSEAELWQQVARAGGSRLAGYFAGASTGGALLTARRSDAGGQLEYRAYEPLTQGGMREYLVSGVELRADFAGARQLPDGDTRSVLEGALAAGEKVAGMLPTSDGATIAAVETTVPGALRVITMWPDGVGTMVVVPVAPSVPSGCLVEQAEVRVSATKPDRAEKSHPPADPPRSRRPLVLGAGAVGLVIAAFAARQAGLFARRPAASSVPVAETTLVPAPRIDTTTPAPDSSAAPTPPVVEQKEPPPKEVKPKPEPKPEPVGEAVPEKPAPPAPRTQDDAADTRELARLQDLATGTQAYSTVQWMALAASAERLFGRLLETKNKGEAARVVLQAYTRAGGDAAACRYLSVAADVSAGERALFRELNKCN